MAALTLAALAQQVASMEKRLAALEAKAPGGGAAAETPFFEGEEDDNKGETADPASTSDPTQRQALSLTASAPVLKLCADGRSLEVEDVLLLLKDIRSYKDAHAGKYPAGVASKHIPSRVQELLNTLAEMKELSKPSKTVEWVEALELYIDMCGNDLGTLVKGVENYWYEPGSKFGIETAKLAVGIVARQMVTAYHSANSKSREDALARKIVVLGWLNKLPSVLAEHVREEERIGSGSVPATITLMGFKDTVMVQAAELLKDSSNHAAFMVTRKTPKSEDKGDKDAKGGASAASSGGGKMKAVVEDDSKAGGGGKVPQNPWQRRDARGASGGASGATVASGSKPKDGASGGASSSWTKAKDGAGGKAAASGGTSRTTSCYNCGVEGHRFSECTKPCKFHRTSSGCSKGTSCPLASTH